MLKFRNGSNYVLLATDLAARGLDIPEIKNIIHFQIPSKEDTFIHRNGRTARMHASGRVFLLLMENKTLPEYLSRNPETIIALAYFDFDVYEPTKICLEAIKPRLVKGSVLGFDELNDPDSPGETLALMEVFGLNNIKLKRFPYTSRTSYFVVE